MFLFLGQRMAAINEKKKYNCAICGYTDSALFTFTDHMITHSKVYPYGCHLCNSRFAHSNQLREHKLLAHKGLSQMPHKKVSSPISKTTRAQHLNYTCPKCNYTAGRIDMFKKHAIEHTGLYRYKCMLCASTFHHTFQLTSHLKRDHDLSKYQLKKSIAKCEDPEWIRTTAELYRSVANFKSDASPVASKPSYTCQHCQTSFMSKLRYASHVFDDHGERLEFDDCRNGEVLKKEKSEGKSKVDSIQSKFNSKVLTAHCNIVFLIFGFCLTCVLWHL